MMNYFIPSWYRDEGSWDGGNRKFDDTVNQVRMFYQADAPVTLVVPAYFPTLRQFQYRQRFFEVPTVSIFDRLQEISPATPALRLQVADLPWPAGTELIYANMAVLGYQRGRLTHRVHFSATGLIAELDLLDQDQVIRRMDFDDRGFVSRVADLTATGWQRHYLDVGGNVRLTVEPNGAVNWTPHDGPIRAFRSMAALVTTATREFFSRQSPATTRVYLAADQGHSPRIAKTFGGLRYGLSYFAHRSNPTSDDNLLPAARLVLADSDINRDLAMQAGAARILAVPPFDTRLQLGTSNQSRQQQILLMVRGVARDQLTQIMGELVTMIDGTDQLTLVVASPFPADQAAVATALVHARARANWHHQYAISATPAPAPGEAGLPVNHPSRTIRFATINDEGELATLIQPCRLVIDPAPTPMVALQIAAISAGIPQLVGQPSLYVADHQNGLVVADRPGAWRRAAEYYLNHVDHWNEALTFASQKIQDYTGPAIVQQIERAMEEG